MSSRPWVFVQNRGEVSNMSKYWFVNNQGSWAQTFLIRENLPFQGRLALVFCFDQGWSLRMGV